MYATLYTYVDMAILHLDGLLSRGCPAKSKGVNEIKHGYISGSQAQPAKVFFTMYTRRTTDPL